MPAEDGYHGPARTRRAVALDRPTDLAFEAGLLFCALLVVALTVALAWALCTHSTLVWSKFGLSFAWTQDWDPVAERFGALPFIYGTLVSSALALLIAVPLGLGSAIFLTELAPRRVAAAVSFVIELLAAVPSVILGLMGIFLLVPAVRAVEPFLNSTLGRFLPLFRGAPYGVSLLAAGLVLAIMIVPYVTVISREVLMTVPRALKEGMLAVGATRWETVRLVSLPYARSGILGAIFLALGRALGETMAVTMVIGNSPRISASLIAPSYSMAAVIANELAEAASDIHLQALIAIGLLLFGVTLVVNAAARWMVYRLTVPGGSR